LASVFKLVLASYFAATSVLLTAVISSVFVRVTTLNVSVKGLYSTTGQTVSVALTNYALILLVIYTPSLKLPDLEN